MEIGSSNFFLIMIFNQLLGSAYNINRNWEIVLRLIIQMCNHNDHNSPIERNMIYSMLISLGIFWDVYIKILWNYSNPYNAIYYLWSYKC